jgi:hypothetical protein
MRDWFRSSAAHNTLSVDGQSSSVPAGPFSWTTIARAQCSSWISEPRFDYVVAAQDGFSRLQNPLIHTRSILFLKDEYWVMHDHIECEGDHKLQFWFHFDSGRPAAHINGNAIECPQVCRIVAFAGNGAWASESGWISHCYGMMEAAPAFSFSMQSAGSEQWVALLLPHVAGTSVPSAKEIPAVGGKAFEIEFAGKRDVLLLRNAQGKPAARRVEVPRIASDFALSWVRFGREGHVPEEFVLIGGQTFELDGRPLETGRSGSAGFCYVRN